MEETMIDPHVHLRDWNQREKETMEHAFTLAWRLGISGVFEMPNTDPPLTTRETIERRIADADGAVEAANVPIFHALYAGITADARQLETVVSAVADLFPRVVGLKLFAGHSTGNMGVVTRTEQALVWNTLASLGYDGVVAVHAESEHLLEPYRWDPTRPITHGAARPPIAELHSVEQQITLAAEAGFTGSLHICHVSVPESLDIIGKYRSTVPFAIRAGVTPHHLFLDDSLAANAAIPEWKVNPPVRPEETRRALLRRLLDGDFNWIESDHAPHTLEDKRGGASGVPGLAAFRTARDILEEKLGRTRADELTGGAVIEAFGLPDGVIPDNPFARAERRYRESSREYPWDPYRYTDAFR